MIVLLELDNYTLESLVECIMGLVIVMIESHCVQNTVLRIVTPECR